jgi:hypothetical protein
MKPVVSCAAAEAAFDIVVKSKPIAEMAPLTWPAEYDVSGVRALFIGSYGAA